MPPVATPSAISWRLACGGEQRLDLLVRVHHAFHVGEEDELSGAEGGGAGDRHLVGIDVVDLPLPVAGHAGDHGHVAVGRSAGAAGRGWTW